MQVDDLCGRLMERDVGKLYARWSDFPMTEWRWPNFSPQEIACKGTGKLMVDERALDMLQALRTSIGKPFVITSAYRSPEHNERVGGAKASKHMEGIAFDIVMANHEPLAFEKAARPHGFHGIGHYPRQGFMHIDTRPREEAARWKDGEYFKASSAAMGPSEIAERDAPARSQAAGAGVATGAITASAGAITAVAGLEGDTQMVAIAVAGVIMLAGLVIFRRPIKRWIAALTR